MRGLPKKFPPRRAASVAMGIGLALLASFAAARPLAPADLELAGLEVLALTLEGQRYPAAALIPFTLDSWVGASALTLLVPDTGKALGAAHTLDAPARRALLESDARLDTGLINPTNLVDAVTARFASPVLNGPGPDLVVCEMHATATGGDPFTLTVNGVTRTYGGADYGDLGVSTSSGDVLDPGGAPPTLAALLQFPTVLGHATINQKILGLAVELDDFGVAPGAGVVAFSFGSATAAWFDPVFIAGLRVGPAPVPPPVPPFAVTAFEPNPAALNTRLTWSSRPDTAYALERSTDLLAWQTVIAPILPQGARTRRLLRETGDDPRTFFRLRETPLPPAAAHPHVLLRSSWQAVNIGDIAHTPGMLQILQNALPEARFTLWATGVGLGVDAMLRAEFPGLAIVTGNVTNSGVASNASLQAAWNDADILVHGSGPDLVALSHVEAWRLATTKPYGIGGVTVASVSRSTRTTLSQAAFVFLRETTSLGVVRASGANPPLLAFGPDATFALALRDEAAAAAYLARVGLDDQPFLCVVPRLRWTPYWEIDGRAPSASEQIRVDYNNTWKEIDHAKLREVIIRWVRETGHPVLACPEMTYAVGLIPELLIDPLPADVKPHVVWRDTYWLTAEAAGVYARAAAVVSFEMHSPIMAVANGVPAFYLRQPTDTTKGQMWRDIGLSDWIFEIDSVTGTQIADVVLPVATNRIQAAARVRAANQVILERQTAMTDAVRAALATRR
ncbi:MAG: polysaccharide pyruvyl transferase family protein [Burkholderiales bacterium]|nr:polysaccharide pyruvyl transferase family protein [Opitutaceae bacterium]